LFCIADVIDHTSVAAVMHAGKFVMATLAAQLPAVITVQPETAAMAPECVELEVRDAKLPDAHGN
jgi:hypothetical protein